MGGTYIAIRKTANTAVTIPNPCRRVGRSPSATAASRIVEAGYSDASTAATSRRPICVAATNKRFPEVSSSCRQRPTQSPVHSASPAPHPGVRAVAANTSSGCPSWPSPSPRTPRPAPPSSKPQSRSQTPPSRHRQPKTSHARTLRRPCRDQPDRHSSNRKPNQPPHPRRPMHHHRQHHRNRSRQKPANRGRSTYMHLATARDRSKRGTDHQPGELPRPRPAPPHGETHRPAAAPPPPGR